MEMFDCVSHHGRSFRYCNDNGCIALEEMICKYGPCKFYKNRSMLDEQRAKCSERIAELIGRGARFDRYGRLHNLPVYPEIKER